MIKFRMFNVVAIVLSNVHDLLKRASCPNNANYCKHFISGSRIVFSYVSSVPVNLEQSVPQPCFILDDTDSFYRVWAVCFVEEVYRIIFHDQTFGKML